MTEAPVSGGVTGEPAQSAKVDPETLVLRARPGRVVRFKRSVIVALTAIAVVGIVAAAWVALKPRTFQLVANDDNASEPARPPADTLGALPSSYAEAPKLGPPLPGDLGRPILEHQRAMAEQGPGAPPSDVLSQREQAAQAERERIAAQARSARESGVLVQTSAPNSAPAAAPVADAPEAPTASSRLALDPQRDPNAQARKADFMAGLDRGGDVNPHGVQAAASPHLLSAGHVIPASLITGLRSDLPGLVIAQVTERVFDSQTGRVLLIPQGTRLIGSYDSVVAFGQTRALLVWQRIVFPDGRSLRIDNVPASDAAGYAGVADKVDFHTWSLLKGVALSTLLGVGSNLTFTGESDLVQAIRESTQQNGARAGDQLTTRNLNIQPTITIRPGTPIRLIVHRDLILEPWNE
ncbi:conjugal transfer protein TrbI [Tsuneonella deserti]|uniref:Conjugal transfer protein TrbI n=1 Tax=Tsuneonella deserti TaxID=2035528 RepID=A0ABQ1SCX9_9SPHN|nr:TrbI/VirB10 family protein [Tsuneonella deserti]GGE05891.1 conjugal transfer protein TrbI [Tsuneonella deserti]